LPFGTFQFTPGTSLVGMWRCECGAGNAHCYKICRYCNARVPQSISYGQTCPRPPQQLQNPRMAPYLSVFPRCPLMPPPPEGQFPRAQRPPITWRPYGSSVQHEVTQEPAEQQRDIRPCSVPGPIYRQKGASKGNSGPKGQRPHRHVDVSGRTVDRESDSTGDLTTITTRH
jgi:hypothetical protein